MTLPCHPNLVTSFTEYASINIAGSLPNELATKNMLVDTLPTAAAKLTSPEGTKGSNRKERIRWKACLSSALINLCAVGYFCKLTCVDCLNPLRYKRKAIRAPMASPINEINVPFQ